MLDRLLHHKLLTEGLEGDGVITDQTIEATKGAFGAQGDYVGVKGHIKFDDGTQADFSCQLLDTSKVGKLRPGTVVPVRYDTDRKHVVLDVLKLEARKAPRKRR